MDKAIEAGINTSQKVLIEQGFIAFCFLLLFVFILVLIWIVIKELLKSVPKLVESVDKFSEKIEARLGAIEKHQQDTNYQMSNLYDATQELINENVRLGSRVNENINLQNQRSENAKADYADIKSKVENMDKNFELIIGGKSYKSKESS